MTKALMPTAMCKIDFAASLVRVLPALEKDLVLCLHTSRLRGTYIVSFLDQAAQVAEADSAIYKHVET